MLETGDSVVVGLSGGADSVSLLYTLLELVPIYDIKISAVHINHQLRGQDSDNDELFCKDLCKRLSVPFFSEKVDVKKYMKENGCSCEESARILRYEVFKKYSVDKIATAHTLSDNAETVIHNLVRGTGLKGITGIPPVRDNIIRPLIKVSRQEVEEYLSEKSQDFVTDCTNLSDDYTRNKIRHNVIPQLEKINGSFLKTMSTNISAFQVENEFISQYCDEVYNKCLENPNTLKSLSDYHKAVRNRCIARFLNEHGLRYSSDRILMVDNLIFSNGKINIAKDVYIRSDSGILFIEYVKNEKNDFCFDAREGVFNITDKKTCTLKIVSDIKEFNENCYIVDYHKIEGNLILRSRKNGDKIKLVGRDFTSSVKKSLINMKIPISNRSELCFLEDSSGLLFAEKLGIAQRVAPDKNTEKFLIIICQKSEI